MLLVWSLVDVALEAGFSMILMQQSSHSPLYDCAVDKAREHAAVLECLAHFSHKVLDLIREKIINSPVDGRAVDQTGEHAAAFTERLSHGA